MKLLVAEDTPMFQTILNNFLKEWGYEFTLVSDGMEAWKRLQEPDAPKLIIFDWMMPRMNGVEVCINVRQIETDSPPYIILITSKSEKEDIVRGLEAGANDYITKPFDHREFHARIEVGRRMVELQSALINRNRELQEALDHVKTLQSILPICMYCKKIRDDHGYWTKLESYFKRYADADFSHCNCLECLKEQIESYENHFLGSDRPL